MAPSQIALVLITHLPRQLFTYAIPKTLRQNVHSGSMVKVPFGSNSQIGLVIEIAENTNIKSLKEIEDVAGESFQLSPKMLSLGRWMSSYYLSPLGPCIQSMVPPQLRQRVKERFTITPLGRIMAAGSGRGRAIQHEILTRLKSSRHGLTHQYLRQRLGSRKILPALATLQKNGHIEHTVDIPSTLYPKIKLSKDSQKSKFRRDLPDMPHFLGKKRFLPSTLASSIQKNRNKVFILQVHQNYRADMYLEAIKETLLKRRSCIVVFPHEAQARIFLSTIRLSLGNRISDWIGTHSLPHRSLEWNRVQSGDADVLVGTRSSIFAPMVNLGLIIVDEEHDFRHKTNNEPRFHTRELSLARAHRENATVILGSLHPSVDAIHMIQSKKAAVIYPPSLRSTTEGTLFKQPNAPVRCIDMKKVTKKGRIFSEPLLDAIETRLRNKELVALFQSRRGFSRSLWCQDCGHTIRCTYCSVALTYYRKKHHLLCHICGEMRAAPDTCSRCSGAHVIPMGFGTEGVEEEARKLFPTATIIRMDKDIFRSKAALLSFMTDLDFEKVDILVGTSMMLDIAPKPPLSLVGVISADTMLHMPDFRASERAFHHLMTIKDLVSDGEILIQALNPRHPMLESLENQNPALFYESELEARRELSFPPFNRLICLRVTGENKGFVEKCASNWASHIRKDKVSGLKEILGPIPAPYSRMRGRYRYHILVKESPSALGAELAQSAIQESLEVLRSTSPSRDIGFEIDVDPQTFL